MVYNFAAIYILNPNFDVIETKILNAESKPKPPPKKFDPKVRIDSEKMTDKEKMDKGFNGKTYEINGIDYDF